ncbi:MAG: phosphatase, partial [Candidatus Accumulibacter sp.]|nr:phosphatase [Accumulibacter sp.]
MNEVLRAASGGWRGAFKRGLLWLAFLGPFFFLSYGFANQRAASAASVPSVHFA